jgi:hypothetical protein
MNFNQAIQKINKLLLEKQPDKITRSWIVKNAPDVYRFIWKNIRAETGEIDWDRVTISLNRRFQKRWIYRKKLTKKQWESRFYENQKEFGKIKEKYKDRLYTFLSVNNEDDWYMRDQISIAFVRIAQKGNILAIQEITNLLIFTIDFWIDHSYRIYNWRGYESEIQQQLEDCIRRYRFTGSFIGYLFKTLEYRGRGLRPLRAYSLDDQLYFGEKRRVENVVKDSETGKVQIYHRL